MLKQTNLTRKLILIIGTVLAGGLVLAGAVKYTSRSEFCKSCHEMESFYAAWQSSSHNSVECIKCHSDSGVTGLVETKIKALGEVYRHVTGTYKKPITINADTAAFSTRCLRCHDNIRGKGKPHNKMHFETNINCAGCHTGLVHNPKTNKKLPDRGVCVKCHGEEIIG